MIDRCPPARHLFIAVPSYSSWVHTETAASLIRAIPLMVKAGITVSTRFLSGSCFVDAARNQLVADFLETDATDLLFVDHDVGFQPATALRICRATRPVVAAVYPKKEDPIGFPAYFSEGERWSDADGLLECTFAPTGFMRINRAVFEALPIQRYEDRAGRQVGDWFRCAMRDVYYGEDIEFCRRWREVGGKVYLLPEETLTHSGMKTWVGNWGEHARSEMGR